ncbi:DUF4099 domain-containing protein [Mucilaginibacter phyllosphaerae]|uniref:DUF4099 domain-containing protein n=1 Tax=Mucilaginibacter phyllosphaerae TaxID=1812349 RepID=A0A4Y8AFH3_9SPHI|nr:DUF4099 domain-containing protein [Mucilaginibacter phyllosphaerae]MBB3971323.1 hypothetical protein [Mucilaginibacter phyllosphaerae]TEW66781.1 DUF4099 domain-containing protein [Mucilaginibacter phyllosphaerae]GGH11903.1 hypothetical protein GCM10007352_18360 [Mucilaginibacter phyllosphaerae]
MNLISFKEMDLPFRELETIGLAAGGQLLLNVNDLKALLSGRRTGLMHLENLEAEGIQIKAMDAKVSLRQNEQGKTDLLIHPIYRKPDTPDFLDDNEARQLEKGEVENFLKTTTDNKGNKKEILVEYDSETREFIVSDTEKIMAPDMVNNEFLTPAQKEKYRKGKEVELADRTKFNYSGTDLNGIRSNKLALIASIVIDGGLSYMVYKGLNALFGEKRDEKEAGTLSPGYYSTMADVEDQRPVATNEHIRFDSKSRFSR